jgi:ATP-dependent Clp endopeptidase proteolytic subunit ClpP
MTILIFDEIGVDGITPDMIAAELKAANGAPVEFRVNSPGGSVFDGLAIYNLIKDYEGETTVIVDGVAASIASIIVLGADKKIMNDGSFFMIHNPFAVATGESKDLRQAADIMDKMKKQIVDIYAKATGKEESEIIALMDAETWFNPQEAVEFGFANEIKNGLKIAANLKTKYIFNNIPEEFKNMEQKEIKNEVEAPVVEVVEVEESAPVVENQLEASIEEVVEETTEEVADGEVVKAEAEQTFNKVQLDEAIKSALSDERERQKQIKNLAFAGQDELVNSLIDEGATVSDAAARIINKAKENSLLMKVEKENSSSLLETFQASAPKTLETGSEEEGDELAYLNKQWNNSNDMREKRDIMKKIVQLKKA